MNAAVSASVPAGGLLRVVEVGGGYKLRWENPGVAVRNLDASLQFKLLNLTISPRWLSL